MLRGHEKVAFQFSGGKDSLAALFALRAHWQDFTVYWLDSGDAVPEVREFVQTIALQVPHFKVVSGRQPEQIADHGWPTDLTPSDATLFGAISLGHTLVLQDRGQCCINSLMLPLAEQMEADGVTLVIRGQKRSDKRKAPIHSGHVANGVEYWFPIEDWTDADVLSFLTREGIALPPYYEFLTASPDCLTCTAYWDENRKRFLQERHPEAWQVVSFRLGVIRQAVREATAQLDKFLEVSDGDQ